MSGSKLTEGERHRRFSRLSANAAARRFLRSVQGPERELELGITEFARSPLDGSLGPRGRCVHRYTWMVHGSPALLEVFVDAEARVTAVLRVPPSPSDAAWSEVFRSTIETDEGDA